ncbi:histidinol-phosphate aminotransferase [Rhodopirellula maiorica SM1]|uniref:Histidinol-phosphate aminotransferase n=2 Tax=Novipirellula TaxID=2795426 RepID=M5RKU7_9BACT|nr:histidinol-phosphate aminotransferase [Rhodopirellula maiorica SM1]
MISIAAATAAMGCQDWLADVVAKMNATRSRLADRLTSFGFNVTPSQANFVWCQHPSGDHQGMYEFLKKNQILVRFMKFPEWGDGLRISVGTDEQIDVCLMLLENYLKKNA